MKYTYISIFFALYSLSSFAQSNRNLIVLDAANRQPLPFSTIRYTNKNLGLYAGENGNVVVSIDEQDTLLVSFTGYLTQKVIGRYLNTDSILLIRDTAKLNEVVIKLFDPFGKPIVQGISGRKPFITSGSKVAVELAARVNITPQIDLFRVDEILIPMSRTKANSTIRIHLYEIGSDGMPGEELLKQDLRISDIQNDRLVRIDVRSQNILSNAKTVFVSVEWIGIQSIEKGNSGPYVRLNQSYPSVNTFTRTINDAAHHWIEFNPHMNSKNPPNLVAQLVIQPMKYCQ